MKIMKCETYNNYLVGFGGAPYEELTKEQRAKIVEHAKNCVICMRNEEEVDKDIMRYLGKIELDEIANAESLLGSLGVQLPPPSSNIEERVDYALEHIRLLGIDLDAIDEDEEKNDQEQDQEQDHCLAIFQ